MKKIICVILAALMLFALVGCGGSTTSPELDLSKSKYLGEDNAIPLPEGRKTATFVINNIDVYKPHGASIKIVFGLYCKELDKAIVIHDAWLNDYINFYGQYSEGDYVKVTWEEDKTGKLIESSLIFEKVSNELVPIKDVGEP